MRRRPNPWIALPALGLGLLAGALGWVTTDLSCQGTSPTGQATSCPWWAAGIAVLAFVVVTLGVALILALVYRSIAEARDKRPDGRP